MRKIFIILVLLMLGNLLACKKNINPSWDIGTHVPLIYTILDFSDIIADTNLLSHADNSLSLVYQYNFYDISLDSLLSFPDTITSNILPSLPGVVLHPGQTFYNLTDNTELNIANAAITQVDFREGILLFNAYSTISENTIVTYKIPKATKNGVPFEITFVVPAGSLTTPVTFQKKINISGYKLDMRGPNLVSSNIFTNTIMAKIDENGNNVNLTAQDQLKFFIRFDSLKFDYIRGDFGSRSFVVGPDTTSFDVFEKFIDGNFDLDQVHLSLDIKNGFGMDARVVFNLLSMSNSASGTATSFNDPIIGQTINISRSTETGNPLMPVNPATYTYQLNNNNAAQMLETMPDKIIYKLSLQTNPLGNISSGNDYIYYNNYLKASLNLEVPLSLVANNLTLGDSIFMKLGDYNPNPSSGTLTLLADNWFPFSAFCQIYLLDNQNLVADSLFEYCLIQAPQLNAELKVTQPRRTEIPMILSEIKYKKLFETKKAWIKIRFNTINASSHLKIYNYYNIKLKLTGNFDYHIDTK